MTAPADAAAVCSACQMPAVLTERGWEHAEAADAVFCAILSGAAWTSKEDAS